MLHFSAAHRRNRLLAAFTPSSHRVLGRIETRSTACAAQGMEQAEIVKNGEPDRGVAGEGTAGGAGYNYGGGGQGGRSRLCLLGFKVRGEGL